MNKYKTVYVQIGLCAYMCAYICIHMFKFVYYVYNMQFMFVSKLFISKFMCIHLLTY